MRSLRPAAKSVPGTTLPFQSQRWRLWHSRLTQSAAVCADPCRPGADRPGQKVKGTEGRTTPEEQLIELRMSLIILAGNLAVKDSVPCLYRKFNAGAQLCEAAKPTPIP